MTNKEHILKYLSGKGWVSNRQIQLALMYNMNPDTVSRECRRMREEGEIDKRVVGKLIEYQIKREQPRLL